MATKNYYEGIKHVVHIRSVEGQVCEECSSHLATNIAVSSNHYINKHGYKLLHVGQETSNDTEGKPWQHTVALLGK